MFSDYKRHLKKVTETSQPPVKGKIGTNGLSKKPKDLNLKNGN